MTSMNAARPPQFMTNKINSGGYFSGGSIIQNRGGLHPVFNGRPNTRSKMVRMQASTSGEEYSKPKIQSFLNDVPLAPPDGILKLSAMFKEDKDPRKVNLGIGAYRDDEGSPFVF
jgi:hypothetical protein